MAINFPQSPNLNDTYTYNNTTWKWDGVSWNSEPATGLLDLIKQVDGAGSGLDADLLDGNHASAFATSSQGTKADTALQPGAVGVSVQPYNENLTGWAGIVPSTKQDTLVSGTTIKTVNSTSLLGSGDVTVQPTLISGTNIKTINGASILGTGDLPIASGVTTISNKTSAYTVVASDLGKIINCTANTFTVSLTSAITLGAGFSFWIWNTGTGVITIDPAGTETVDGRDPGPYFTLSQGGGVRLVSDGTGWVSAESRVFGLGSASTGSGILTTQIGANGSGYSIAQYSGAVALGGSGARGQDSFAVGIGTNSSFYGASTNGFAFGIQARAYIGTALGRYAYASGVADVTAIGSYAKATGRDSVAIGTGALADVYGKIAFSSGFYNYIGDAQSSRIMLRRTTANETPTVLTSDASTAGALNQLVLRDSSIYLFRGQIVARNTDGASDTKAWEFKGAIRRGASAATTALVGMPVIDLIASDGSPWTFSITADTTNGALAITATGESAKTIKWLATIDTTES